MSKTHYRRVFKSDHLSSYDLEDFIEQKKPLIFTIKEVKQEWNARVAGKTTNANICYFKEDIKPLVLNAVNSKVVSKLCNSSMIEDWKDIKIELYILKNIRFGKENVQGVRIKEEMPKPLTKEEILKLKNLLKECKTKEKLTEIYNSDNRYKIDAKCIELIKAKNIELTSKN